MSRLQLMMMLMLGAMHDFDEDGVCKDCGFDIRSFNEEAPRVSQVKKQTTEFINQVVLSNGETIKMAPPILDENGELVEGKFFAEVKKEANGIYVVKRIGQG